MASNYLDGRLADGHDHFTLTLPTNTQAKPGTPFSKNGKYLGIVVGSHSGQSPADQWGAASPIPVCIAGVIACPVAVAVLSGQRARASAANAPLTNTGGTLLPGIFLENGAAGETVPVLLYGGV